MRLHRDGKTNIVEIVFVVVLLLVAAALFLPTLGTRRGPSRKIQNSVQVRGIQGAMVLFAQGNNNFYPGWNGSDLQSFQTPVGWCQGQADGQDPAQRFALLLLQNFFTGEYAISPREGKQYWSFGTVTSANYSYTMLQLAPTPIAPVAGATPTPPTGRLFEWSSTINTAGPVLSDRSVVQDSTLPAASYWAKNGDMKPSHWQGSVAWNDNHVTFESSPVLGTTRFGTVTNTSDDLFTATGDSDAYMIYSK